MSELHNTGKEMMDELIDALPESQRLWCSFTITPIISANSLALCHLMGRKLTDVEPDLILQW